MADDDIEDARDWLDIDPENPELSREDLITAFRALEDELNRKIDKWIATLQNRGLASTDTGLLIIADREKAVAWFERELVDFEEA